MAYVVAGMPFKAQTAKAILDRCRDQIAKEWRRVALEGDELEFMMVAWSRSPGYREKDGDAVVGIGVVRNTGSGYGFRAIYGDSSDIDFAYEPCFTGIPGNPTNKVLHALRHESQSDFERRKWFERRDANGGRVVCERCGKEGPVHFHHSFPEFAEIKDAFLKARGIKLKDIEVRQVGSDRFIVDPGLKAAWITHVEASTCGFEFLCADCHKASH